MMRNLLAKHFVLPRHDHLKGLPEQRIEWLRKTASLNLGILHHLMNCHESESAHFILLGDCLVKKIEKLA